jgi:alkanesulfonate monooxygenase
MNNRKMKLGAAVNNVTGVHIAGWLHPNAPRFGGPDIKVHARTARLLEAAKFDFMFLADMAAVQYGSDLTVMSRIAPSIQLEPLTLLAALSGMTDKLGLVASNTTTYNEPFHLARFFASLDHLSGGRAGWNVITSANPDEAHNFSRNAHMAHADRYERAQEALEIVCGLWDSWDDDAFRYDKEAALCFDPAKLHFLNHQGALFSVRGPLNVPRPPQGHPVIVQSGSSEPGKALGAKTADVIFSAQHDIEDARTFYADMKDRVAKCGRNPSEVLIMPGVVPIVGRTRQEAEDKYAEVQQLIHPDVGLQLLSNLFGGADLSGYPLDGPVPDLGESNAIKSRQDLLLATARRENLTIRQLYQRAAGARGHWTLVGSAEEVAEILAQWFLTGAADGFNILPPFLPDALTDFIDLVLPELRERGLFRDDYEGSTLRENLGLPRPASRYEQVAQAV